ncbi:MAG TPA: hypothetical protein DCL41_00700 [Bdellovibrionales bacterium]|nr:hypothetical protein [Pseudobdellovibrionaceae bacterium]HAG90355.1 hypothetical protein [Bdellovibrionales bacterium]
MASTPSFASESKSRLGKILIAGAVLTGTIASVISDTVANGTESSAKRKYWRDLDQNLGDLSIDQLHLTDASPSNLMFDISSQIHPEMKIGEAHVVFKAPGKSVLYFSPFTVRTGLLGTSNVHFSHENEITRNLSESDEMALRALKNEYLKIERLLMNGEYNSLRVHYSAEDDWQPSVNTQTLGDDYTPSGFVPYSGNESLVVESKDLRLPENLIDSKLEMDLRSQ